MDQINMFDIPSMETQINPPEPSPFPDKKCKHCHNIYQHEYNQTKYCAVQRQKGTSYGDKKIKANDCACKLFTPKQPNQ